MRRPIPYEPHRARRQAGFVILFVLVMVLLTAFLLARFVDRAGTELLADARAAEQARLRREAYSALEASIAVLADLQAIDGGLHSPEQGWAQPLLYADYQPEAGFEIAVEMEDESGKLSLPQADLQTLETLLVTLGVDRIKAAHAADALLAWTRPDYVPVTMQTSGSDYAHAALPHQAAERPLRDFGELAAVAGVRELFFNESGRPTPLARDFAAHVSLYSFARTNLNTASRDVLVAGGLDAGQAAALTSRRQRQPSAGGRDYLRGSAEAAALLGGGAVASKLGTEVSAVRIMVRVRGGTGDYRVHAVVAPPSGATLAAAKPRERRTGDKLLKEVSVPAILPLNYPFKILEIQENVASPTATASTEDAHG